MAEALVGGAFLSASLQVLFDRLASRELISFFSKRKLDDGLIDKLKAILLALQAVQDDAEDKQITNKHVKAWLDELQHVVYQAEDLLDEITTKALRDKLEADHHHQSQSQNTTIQVGFTRFLSPIKQSLLRINNSISNSAYMSEDVIESRMRGLISKLEWFVKQKKSLNLRENVGRKQLQRQETTSLVDESDVYGRTNDKEKIFELLLSGNATDNGIGVIPIVGMGGMGKTTLAQFVYNDARVNEIFHVKSWVCVSEAFDICMITKKILDDVTASNNDINSLDQLQIKLKESLAGEKFLIVLDDVWNDNYVDWDLLRRPFKTGAPESRIVVTTRTDKVASVVGTAPSHHLKQLSFDDSWSLFAKHAFGSRDYVAYSDLKKIGEQIVEKCKGLPLAIKSIGGLLRSKLELEEWENILKNEIWDLQESKILPALKLSYHYLPSHLKRCFAYCSIFPKDYKIEKEKLVQLWIAIDLVQQHKNNTLLEDAGNYYFCELLARSFFQKSTHSYFLMHDLIHDLAQDISGEFCLMLEDGKPLNHICEKIRHFSYVKGTYDAFEKFKAVNEFKYLRTFISFFGGWGPFLGNKVLHDLLPSLRCLRVLSLSKYQIFELPQSIENLIHLRYLDLSVTNIKRLPDSITTLCNLQTLDLSYCVALAELPMNMGKLINLRHLDIRETKLTKMPMQMSRLKDLQHLTYFVVGRNNGSRISGLKEICQLRGQLLISGLQNVTSGLDASEANMKDKKHLEGLVLEWNGDTSDTQKERDILDKLQPHAGVKYLSIFKYGSTRFPDWLGGAHSFHNMVSLSLKRCANCCSLPPIGQLPSLKYLGIEGMKSITEVGWEFYGNASSSSIKPFQSLEILSFKEMEEWEEWQALGVGEFSRLLELSMVDCPKLTGELSIHFPSLRKLEISKCQQLVSNQVGLLLQDVPSLREMEISGIPNLTELPPQLQHLSSLQELIVSHVPNLRELPPELQHLSSLQKLMISDIPNLTELPSQLQHLSSLQNLEISGMPNLKELPLELCRLINLELLTIKECSGLVSFPDMGLPPMLKSLEIKRCSALQSLTVASTEGMDIMRVNNICLEELCISECSSLLEVSFPFGGLPPPTLETLEISNCRSLEFPLSEKEMEEHNYHTCSIEVLKIDNSCDHLKSLSLGFFPKLLSLLISGCINFKTLSIPNDELRYLLELKVKDCPEMVSFAHGNGGLPAPNMTSFSVYHCKNLVSLPLQMYTLLPSLQSLIIVNCPEVEAFPDGGLPSKLSRLAIYNCEKLMKGRMGWGFQTLPSLGEFYISGAYEEEELLESFPEEWLLPTTLTYLVIQCLPNLKSLNHKGLQHLSALAHLYIQDCPKLQSLPEERLPNSLSRLTIWNCPLLKPRCQRNKGEDWPNISQIRHIRIDGEDIINLE